MKLAVGGVATVVAIVFACAGGCDSGSSSGGAADASTTSSSTSSGGTGSSGATSSSGGSSGASSSSGSIDSGPACIDVVANGTAIQSAVVDAAAPTATGGTIVDGTYVLTEYRTYPPVSFSFRLRGAVRFTGDRMDWLLVDDTGGYPDKYRSSKWSTNGTELTEMVTCEQGVGPSTITSAYNATATTFELFESSKIVQVFTKQ